MARKNRTGGGVALVYRASLNIVQNAVQIYSSFEVLDCSIKVGSAEVMRIYSPAPKHGNASDCNIFLDEFAGMLEHELLLSVGKLMILGDFNYHLDDLTDNNVRKFNNLLHACGLVQHVTVPTHVEGHILDAVITRDGEIDVVNIQTNLCIESDHYTALFDIDVPCTGTTNY